VRWSLKPEAPVTAMSGADFARLGPDHLAQEIAERVAKAPQRWTLMVTEANPGDPTNDPSQAWPADRKSIAVGTLVVRQIQPEPNGPCRDINFDPTILPDGIAVGDDPFPAARSAVYAKSFDARMAEEKSYPHGGPGGDAATAGAQP
jgi:catalase